MRIDFSPLYRSTVGFDRLFSLMDGVGAGDASQPAYPPYNIERTAENAYRITMAVAGFAAEDLGVELKENTLTIKGEKTSTDETRDVLYRGIASRSFERRFQLADHMLVEGAGLENGLLHIDLARRIPEELKPRRIPIAHTVSAARLSNPTVVGDETAPKVEAA